MRIIVIGESCKDIFIYGDCNRLSPEAPIPVLIPSDIKNNFGMSGNVVKNIEALNDDVRVIHIYQKESITKTRYVDRKSNHMFLRVDEGEENITPFHLNISKRNVIQNSDLVIVSDYDKGFLNLEQLSTIGKLSKVSILDSKKKLTKEVVDSFSFVKLNEGEFQKNKDLFECKNIITTLGSKGARFDGVIYESPSPKETIDVSGAGDTFTSAFILEFYRTKDIPSSIVYANEMASIVVSKRGVATPN
jgi:D-beta-D-heptose 7-phosphate kinase/D-beta-D-heptose 1-phosphate adenosyltransferase